MVRRCASHAPLPPKLLLPLVAVMLAAASGCWTNPVTGGMDLMLMSADQELSMGDNSHPSIIFMYDGECRDPELKQYLGTIVMRLNACSHRAEMRTDFTLLNSSIVNAFAIPGHVYATRGFVARIPNEAQFAAVMGHELGHVAAGHSGRKMSRQQLMILGLGLTGAVLGDNAQGALAVGQAGVALLGLSYSREMERQADRLGTYYMAVAGWDPGEAIGMQRLLNSLSSHKGAVLDSYLSTHPPMEDRLGEIQALIEEKQLAAKGWRQGDGVYARRWLARTSRLRRINDAYGPYDRGSRELAEGKFDKALASAEQAIRARSNQAPFHRLKGDALRNLNRLPEARAAYEQALRVDPRYVPANIGLGQVAFQQNDFAEAERQFAVSVHGFPGSGLAHYGLGMARYRQSKHKEAIQPLETAAGVAPRDPELLFALAYCYDRTARQADAYRAYRLSLAAGMTGDAKAHAERRVKALKPVVDPDRKAK